MDDEETDVHDVLVIGGGYAGVHAARTAVSAGAAVTVLDATGRHDLSPRLAAVAAGRRGAGDAWAPLDELVDATVLVGRAARVDADRGTVELADGRVLEPAATVVTIGAEAALPPVDGVRAGEAWTLRDAADALRLRGALPDAERLVVVGGGATGVQLAAEAAVQHPGLAVHLVEATERLLGGEAPALGRRAARILRRRGVDVRTGTGVERADGHGVVLADGERLDGVVVWCTGVAADGNALLPDAPTTDGRLLVDRMLRVGARTLAAGDVAAHRDLLGRVTAQSAQLALQAGRAAGRNAAAIAAGRSPASATLVDLGRVVDLGGRAVARVGPLDLALPGVDRLVPLLHEFTDVRHLVQAAGPSALLRHAPGRHRPSAAEVRRAERPELRSVG